MCNFPKMKADQERVRGIIHNTIISLCENGLKFDKHLRIEGVIGVTTDEQEIFLIHINESLNAESCTGQPFPGGRPQGVGPGGPAPRLVAHRSPETAAFVRARPSFQSSPNNSMGLRGFMRGSPRMNFGSPRMQAGLQRSPAPFQRTPMKSPRNPLQGMPRLQRFSPKASPNSSNPQRYGKPGLLSLPAPLTKEVFDEPRQTLAPRQLLPSGPCQSSSSQFPQICDVPCKLEKVDVILVDDDDHMEFIGKLEKAGDDRVESTSSPGHSLPDLEPDLFPTGPASQTALGEIGTIKDLEAGTSVQCEPQVSDQQSTSASVPGCSGITIDTLNRVDKDDKSSTHATADNSSLTSFDMGVAFDRPFNPEDYATEEDDLDDPSFSDPNDEDWKTDGDSMSDPDWSEKSPRKKKQRVTPRVTPKKTGLPGGTVLTPKQVSCCSHKG